MREKCRKNHGLLHFEQRAVATVFWNFKDNGDISSIQGESFLNRLCDSIFVGSLIALEPPNLGVVLWQVLIWVPVAILE